MKRWLAILLMSFMGFTNANLSNINHAPYHIDGSMEVFKGDQIPQYNMAMMTSTADIITKRCSRPLSCKYILFSFSILTPNRQ